MDQVFCGDEGGLSRWPARFRQPDFSRWRFRLRTCFLIGAIFGCISASGPYNETVEYRYRTAGRKKRYLAMSEPALTTNDNISSSRHHCEQSSGFEVRVMPVSVKTCFQKPFAVEKIFRRRRAFVGSIYPLKPEEVQQLISNQEV